MPRTIEDLDLVGHTCMVPVSDEHAWEATAAYISRGLTRGEQVVYFEDATADRLLERLADDRVPVDSAISGGQFLIVPTEATRAVTTGPLDGVEPAMTHVIGESREQGWPGVRIIGEAARGRIPQGLNSLVAYEQVCDEVLRDNPTARLLCLYDRRRFDEGALDALRSVHGSELTGPPAYDDGLLRVTRPAPSMLRLAGEIDHSNRSVLRGMLDGALEDTLRSVDVPVDVTLDLASLRFLDVAGAVEVIRGAQQFPGTQRVLLRGPRSRVQRALQRCGAGAVEQLVVEPSTPAAGSGR
ncbi:MEDS domain-containing protein [Pseudonocardia sp. KRD291]|uniref:MEDS domain-containing protein n=1 Tax=Pseudonocardia sp. KRD291 TaxID=2792007 RepID=UPI001C4A2772|nr:MEDS domain-containing protein [Pseudonocardia sp. KRD291]MBW0102983.1 MEDS domain-containing protein [Pseudonocardia sp. KRD291]